MNKIDTILEYWKKKENEMFSDKEYYKEAEHWCKTYLSKINPIKTRNDDSHSYGQKHRVEYYLGEHRCYVFEGTFIRIAHELGFKLFPDHGMGVSFNFSKKDLNALRAKEKTI